MRFGIATTALTLLAWVLMNLRMGVAWAGLSTFSLGFGISLYCGLLTWAFYLAVEPAVRRRLPDRLTSWTRLLNGQWRDPLVGRDLLIGAAAGTALVALARVLMLLLVSYYRVPLPVLEIGSLHVFRGAHLVVFDLLEAIVPSASFAFFLLLLTLLIGRAVRKLWLAVSILGLFLAALELPQGSLDSTQNLLCVAIPAAVMCVSSLLLMLRFGMVVAVMLLATLHMASLPGAGDLTAWQAKPMLIGFALISAIAFFGFYVSLAGRPLAAARRLPAGSHS
jgi:serine/threonine-protein kinase